MYLRILFNTWIYVCTCSKGERSLEKEEQFAMMGTQEQKILDASVPVEPFDMEERVKSIHERRRRQTYSNRDNIRYVLFILDTSGSIGRSQFVRVKYLLALMSEKLCDHLRVSMITYGLDIKLEFCFNCTWTGVEYSMPSHVCPVPRGIHSHHWRHQVCLPDIAF